MRYHAEIFFPIAFGERTFGPLPIFRILQTQNRTLHSLRVTK